MSAPLRSNASKTLSWWGGLFRALTRRPLRGPSAGDSGVAEGSSFGAFATQAYPNMVVAIWVLLAIEMPAMHLLLGSFMEPSPGREVLRWGMLASSLYLGSWLVGDLRLMREAPLLRFRGRSVELRLGQRVRADLEVADIAEVHRIVDEPSRPRDPKRLRVTPLQAPNLRIELKAPTRVRMLYGIQREVQAIELFVDDPEAALRRFPSPETASSPPAPDRIAPPRDLGSTPV